MATTRPTTLKPQATFEAHGRRCEVFGVVSEPGIWTGHVTVRPPGKMRQVERRLIVKGQYVSLADFLIAARATALEYLAAT